MKIGIYAPAKNELKHVNAWFESCKNADVICVADTGSTDGTRERMIELGVRVTDVRIIPWRFDDAFNTAMYLLPEDVDVCIRLDLDERLQPGWREALEAAWTPETTQLRYEYVWNWDAIGRPGLTWWGDRIHARKGYRWRGATHEGLDHRLPEVETYCKDVKIWQFPDAKAKNDLPLLLECIREAPHDARSRLYLAREYMYQRMHSDACRTFREYLDMTKESTDHGERAFAMRCIAKMEPENTVHMLAKAHLETPLYREPLVELSQHYYNQRDWYNCLLYSRRAMQITERPLDYTCSPEAWGSLPYDLASVAAWNLGQAELSCEYARKALSYEPNDVRLQNNLKLIEDHLQNVPSRDSQIGSTK